MNFSKGIQEKVVQFAQEQAPHYFAAAETANTETNKPKAKAAAKYAEEATNDFSLYMLDYMQDLLSQELSEEATFQKAASSDSP